MPLALTPEGSYGYRTAHYGRGDPGDWRDTPFATQEAEHGKDAMVGCGRRVITGVFGLLLVGR